MSNYVSVPPSFFIQTAKRDYNAPREAFFREFLQNSVDAGSKNIELSITSQTVDGNEKVYFTCNDDGCGMTEDIIRNKLLVLGATSKDSNAAGGFGVAKILIYFSHPFYKIHTKDNIVKGSGGSYEVQKNNTFVKGCHATVEINPDIFDCRYPSSLIESLIAEIRKSYLPNINISVNGEAVKAKLKKGRQIVDLGDISIHKKKVDYSGNYYAFVRVNGLHMFQVYMGNRDYELTIELKGYSVDILTSNRDGFRNAWRTKIDNAIDDITNDPSKQKASTSKTNFYVGKSSRLSTSTEAATIQTLEDLSKYINEQVDVLDTDAILSSLDGQIEQLTASLSAAFSAETLHQEIKKKIDYSKSTGEKINLTYDLKDILTYNVPIKTVGRYRKVPINWNPANFNDKQKNLLSLWGKIVGLVLRDTKHEIAYEAGYIFDDGHEKDDDIILAQYHSFDDRHVFYLNPTRYDDQNFFPMAANKRTEVILWLVSIAIHEVTHYAGYSGHNYEFVRRENHYKLKVFKNIKEYLSLTF